MSPKTISKDQRRAHVLEAAIAVFARKGFAASRIDDVAAEAGVAKGTVYLYFDSRDAILHAAFEAFERDLLTGIHAVRESNGPALARLSQLVRGVIAGFEAQADLTRVLLDFWVAGTSDAPTGVGIELARVYAEYRSVVEQLLRQAQSEGTVRGDLTEHSSAVVVGMIEGVMVQWLVEPDAVPLGPVAEQIIDVLVRGLSIRP